MFPIKRLSYSKSDQIDQVITDHTSHPQLSDPLILNTLSRINIISHLKIDNLNPKPKTSLTPVSIMRWQEMA